MFFFADRGGGAMSGPSDDVSVQGHQSGADAFHQCVFIATPEIRTADVSLKKSVSGEYGFWHAVCGILVQVHAHAAG